MVTAAQPPVCPACGTENDADAVFCGGSGCRKALGEFRYVIEELERNRRWHENLADRVTRWIASPHFVAAHFTWLGVWILLNTALGWLIGVFDQYPFFGLVTLIAIETLFISVFVLISSSRQSAHQAQRAELDYEVNVRTYRIVRQLRDRLDAVEGRLESREAIDEGAPGVRVSRIGQNGVGPGAAAPGPALSGAGFPAAGE